MYRQYREKILIHKNPRIKLWTSRNFLSGSSALAIGYFLLNFLRASRRSLSATLLALLRTRSELPTAGPPDHLAEPREPPFRIRDPSVQLSQEG